MGKHTIEIIGGNKYLNRYRTYLNEALHSSNYHEAAFYLDVLAHLIDWNESNWQVEVDSLEQYFTIIEAVAEMTDGEYTICNSGHTIDLS